MSDAQTLHALIKQARTWKIGVWFDPDGFERAIDQIGMRLLWEKGSLCPCKNNDYTAQPLADCPVCGGDGWEYWGAQVVPGILDALDLDKDTQIAYGVWSMGTARVTMHATHRPSIRDRLTNLDGLIRFTERRTRAAGVSESLRYPIGLLDETLHLPRGEVAPEGSSPQARATALEFETAAAREHSAEATQRSVLRCRVLTGDGTPGAPLTSGTDFEVVDGRLDWSRGVALGTAPSAGGDYAIDYLTHPRYLVHRFNHAMRDQWIKHKHPAAVLSRLPVETQAKLDFLPGADPYG